MVLLLTAFALVLAAASQGAAERLITLFDAPRGIWLGTVRADAQITVVEERAGWRRVRVEGWLPAPPDSRGPAPAGERRDAGATAGATVRGVLGGAGAPTKGAGLVVLLVSDLRSIDRESADVRARCRARLDAIDLRIERLRAEYARALNSSDNFREAADRSDRAAAQLGRAEGERDSALRDCHEAADSVYRRHAVQRAITDAAGRFEFSDVRPGRYRAFAVDPAADPPFAWSIECQVAGRDTVVLDPDRDRASPGPYADLD